MNRLSPVKVQFPAESASLLARAYLRLLSLPTNPPTNGQLDPPADSQDSASERLDSRRGIVMTCAGRDDAVVSRVEP